MTVKDRVYAGLLAVLSVVSFIPMYISGRIIGWLDAPFYFMPFRLLTGEAIRAGDMPFWNPYIFCGNPLMANMQSAVFYPLNVFFGVFGASAAVQLSTFCTFFIMAASMYFLLRLYKHSEEASFIGACLLAFSTFSTIKAVEFADINSLAWIPAAAYFTKRFADSGRGRDMFFIPLALSLSFLGGHPQVFLYGYAVFLFFYFYETLRGGWRGRLAGSLKSFLAVNAIFAAMVMIQLLPSAEFAVNSRRMMGGIGLWESAATSLGFEHLAAFFVPPVSKFFSMRALFMNWIGMIDIGALGVILFLFGVFLAGDRGRRNMLMSLLAVSVVMAFIGSTYFYPWLYEHLNFISGFRYPGKAILMAFFAICFLAASGYDALFTGERERLKAPAMAVIITAAAGLLLYLAGDLFRDPILKAYKNMTDPGMKFEVVYRMVETYGEAMGVFLQFTVMLIASAALVYAVVFRGVKNPAMRFTVAAAAVVFMMVLSNVTTGLYVKPEWLTIRTPQVNRLLSDPALVSGRVLAPVTANMLQYQKEYGDAYDLYYYNTDAMLPNTPMNFKIRNADGFDSLFLGDFAEFKSRLNSMDRPWDAPAFGLLGTRYISSKPALQGRSLRLFSKGWSNLYLNSNDMGPAFVAGKGARVYTASRDKAPAYFVDNGLKPASDLLVLPSDREKAEAAIAASTGGGTASVEWKGLNSCEVDVKGGGGVLVLTDNYYNGWKAWIDGKKTGIMRVDVTFKGVVVPAGEHKVRFKYEPMGFAAAALISILVLLVLLPVVPALIRLF